MDNMRNGMFAQMCKEAVDELADGKHGWREANPNIMLLACFHLLTNHLSHKLATPLWWAASSIMGAALIFVIKLFIEWVEG